MVLTQTQQNNFWSKVDKTNYCWQWTGYKAQGYGKVNIGYTVYMAHKISLILSGILISPVKAELGASGEIIMHTCDNRACVNPSHLKVATQKENMQDAQMKGRKWVGETAGERNGRAKLTENVVSELKKRFRKGEKVPVYSIAKQLGVSPTQLYLIRNNKSWTHVK